MNIEDNNLHPSKKEGAERCSQIYILFSVENKKIQFLISNQFLLFAQNSTVFYKQKQQVLVFLSSHTPKETSMHYSFIHDLQVAGNERQDYGIQTQGIKSGTGRKKSTREIQETTSMQDKSTNCLETSNKKFLLSLLKSYKNGPI
jgi:hypothetical protein